MQWKRPKTKGSSGKKKMKGRTKRGKQLRF
jgi:hypothetical protein